jgi:hypothetical protein
MTCYQGMSGTRETKQKNEWSGCIALVVWIRRSSRWVGRAVEDAAKSQIRIVSGCKALNPWEWSVLIEKLFYERVSRILPIVAWSLGSMIKYSKSTSYVR